ncbi:hypothetical protein, partial [Rahnella aquatilis]|uniref:hypothetical protein n=1 Tax=Rahnella aquatilis TaxID=34038 RepID=UPI001E6107A0
ERRSTEEKKVQKNPRHLCRGFVYKRQSQGRELTVFHSAPQAGFALLLPLRRGSKPIFVTSLPNIR